MSSHQKVETVIFGAAQTLLQTVGDAFTMEQLETRSGVSRATIYRRVGNKEKLLERLASERGETYEREDISMTILRAAQAVFGREGLVAATVEQIATEAGVGVATVYRHFGDKDTLVKSFIKEMTPKRAIRDLALHPTEDVRADLEKLVGVVLPFFYENRNIFRLVLMGNERDRQYLQGLRKRSDSTQERIAEYFATQLKVGRLKDVGKPDELALALMGMVIAYAVLGPLHHGRKLENVEETGKLIVQLFLSDLRGNA